MNGIEYIVKILKAEGVESMTCFPANPLIEAAAKEEIRPIAFRHERGAVMAADGFSRTNDRKRFGVVAIQSQAGAENSMGGLAQAYADNIPILVLPGGISLSQIGVRPNFPAAQNYKGIVKQVEAIYSPDQVGNVMRRAFHALRNGVPGPVVVELTADVCNREVPVDAQNYKSPKAALQVPSSSDIKDAVQVLTCSQETCYLGGGRRLALGRFRRTERIGRINGNPGILHNAREISFRRTSSIGFGRWLWNYDIACPPMASGQ